jgi:hypothetical protein
MSHPPTPPPLPVATPTHMDEASVQAYLNQQLLIDGRPVSGAEGMTLLQVEEDVLRGGRFRTFPWSFSLVILSFRRSSPLIYVPANQWVGGHAWLWTLPSLFLGWWGIPWGFLFTLMNIYRNAMGGRELTPAVLQALLGQERATGILTHMAPRKADPALWCLRACAVCVPIALIMLLAALLS